MRYQSGKLVAVAVLLLGLVACAPLPRTTVEVIGDKFSKDIQLNGLENADSFDGDTVDWKLRSFVDPRAHTATHQIYVDWFFQGHGTTKYFASDDTARPLPTRRLLKESCGRNCGQTDTITIEIDEATLRARAAAGFQVKLRATDGGTAILDITSKMISAQLQTEDQVFRAGSVGAAVVAATPEVVKGANEGAVQLERFSNARYRITAAAASVCPSNRIQPTSGVGMLTLSALDAATRGPILAAYPWLSDDVSIVTVAQTSPAERAGLRAGDFVVAINGNSPAKGASGADSAAKLIQASGMKSWRMTILRNGTRQEIVVTPAKACGVVLKLSREETASIAADGSIGAGFNAFIRSDDDEAAILAFALAMQIASGTDLDIDKTSLTVLAWADYQIDSVPDLWQRLADAKTQLTAAHPLTAERLAAMRRAIGVVGAGSAAAKPAAGVASSLLPFDPNAPASAEIAASHYSVKDSGIGIGVIPMLGSKTTPGKMADGLMVSSVQRDSAAEAAGLKIGDVMTSFDGHSLADVITASDVYNDVAARAIAKGQPGTAIPVDIVRNGRRMKLTIHL